MMFWWTFLGRLKRVFGWLNFRAKKASRVVGAVNKGQQQLKYGV
jgi:hypothetical protein